MQESADKSVSLLHSMIGDIYRKITVTG